jgi:hypothetical protein
VHNERRRTHGCKVREESAGQSREGDARTEARHPEERKLGQEGEEPQTGHRHRTVGSAERRRQSAVEEVVFEEVVFKEVVREEVICEEVIFKKVRIEKVVGEEIVGEEIDEEVCEEALAAATNRVPAEHRHRQECLCPLLSKLGF